jgi:Protein of unknown function (DUF1580)
MVDGESKRLIPIAAVVELPSLTRSGRRLHESTPARWALYGLNGIRLESTKIAGRRYTWSKAVEKFLEDCAAASNPGRRDGELPWVSSPCGPRSEGISR